MSLNILINPKKYSCELCMTETNSKKDFNKHISTAKHINRTNLNNIEQTIPSEKILECKFCKKAYKARNSLWYHEKKCANTLLTPQNENSVVADASNNEILTNLVLELLKKNTKLQDEMIEICKNKLI